MQKSKTERKRQLGNSEELHLLERKPIQGTPNWRCEKKQFREHSQVLEKKVKHNNCANRMAKSRRWIIQISALSTVDCRIEAYNGDNGYGELGFDSGEGA